ncbi:META domain-containing protein, partial [Promineifilum sp.]|uniref:META domain-containing protein n=1 Tax=Promineifilum sp. TaxID=2664178 RepID=UPI0035B4C050
FEDTFLVLGLPDGGSMRLLPAAATGGEGGLEAAPALTGATWQWVQTVTPETTVVATDPARYTITFNDDGTAAIQADCNSVTATYTASEADSTLTITPGASTLMACPEDSQATDFLNGLSAAAIYFFQDGDLYIDMFASSGTMQFTTDAGALEGAPAEPVLTGATWQWTDVMSGNTATAVADPTRYTITFNEDGTAAIKADCNSVTSTYTAADGAMTLTLGASTLAACPPDSQADEFTAGLSTVTGYAFQDGNLVLSRADGGTMLFSTALTEGATSSGEAGGGAAGTTEGGTGEKGAGLTGATWTWTALHTPASSTTVNDPSRFTLTFNADGTAHIQADCNQVRATYTVSEGNLLTVAPGASTMAYCGPGSLDQIYLGGLTNAMGYRLEGGELIIDMLYESGSLVFAAAQ